MTSSSAIYSSNPNHWSNYLQQIEKYLNSIKDNPYKGELESDFKREKVERITNNFLDQKYINWFNNLVENKVINDKWLNMVNYKYNDSLKLFCNYLEENYKFEESKLLNIVEDNVINNYINKNTKKIEFNPTSLKFVTTTGIAYLDFGESENNKLVNFSKFYEHFIPPENVVKNRINKSDILYNENVVNKIIGCKTGDKPIKGYFKNSGKDFYNCATLNVVLTNTKSANVKMFANGKLQLTGIPSPEMGTVTLKIICDLIKKMDTDEITKNKDIKMKSYKTVMINTCYELGFQINREVLYNIMLNKYKIQTIYESDGYPGVRIQYFYNSFNTNTINEGKCTCRNSKCNGKGNGIGYINYQITEKNSPNEEINIKEPINYKFKLPENITVGDKIKVPILNNCRKISIAVFQSGSVIIAGGCNSIEPIELAYKFINNIITIIYKEIKKNNTVKKTINKKKKIVYLDKSKIKNLDLYNQLLNTDKIINKVNKETKINKKKILIKKKTKNK